MIKEWHIVFYLNWRWKPRLTVRIIDEDDAVYCYKWRNFGFIGFLTQTKDRVND